MKKFIFNFLRTFWRIWFYIIFTVTVLISSPFLLFITSNEKWYPIFFKIARVWAKIIIIGMGFRVKKESFEELSKDNNYMFIANHTSMIDAMVMLVIIKKPFVFIGKSELAKIPIFGFFYKKTCILVDRKSESSRKAVFEKSQKRIKDGLSICIFPEGFISNDESIILGKFKSGAFRLAIEHQMMIVLLHFMIVRSVFSYTFFSGRPGILRAKIHHFISTKGFGLQDISSLKNMSFKLIYDDLISDKFN